MNCKVSIIVLTFNQEKYVKQAIDSILLQNFPFPIEILIGDDASKDKTPEILQNYAQKYPETIHLYLHQENIGASKNIYSLFTKANGEYIALLEGDDYWSDNNKLKTQIQFLEKNKNYSGCTHDCLIVDRTNHVSKHQSRIWLSNKKCFTLHDCRGFYLSGQTGTLVFRNIFKDSQHNFDIIYKAHPMISDRTIQTILTAMAPLYHFESQMSVYRSKSSEQGENATTLLFENNPHSTLENFDLTITLEKYIQNEFNLSLRSESVKRMFFTVALTKALIKPTKEKWDIVASIFFNKEAKKLQYLLLFPFEVLKRLCLRVKERI